MIYYEGKDVAMSMTSHEFYLEFYETLSKHKPIEEFLVSLDNKTRTKVIHMLMLLREKGTELREPYSKYLKNGIFELRIQQGGNSIRVLYFFFIGRRIVLTNGFVKKTRAVPSLEIEKAYRYKQDYEERHNG